MKSFFFLVPLFLIGVPSISQSTIDTALTDYARFLAGQPCLSKSMQNLQTSAAYTKHMAYSQKMWTHIKDSTLDKIDVFNGDKNIISVKDTNTCFYPFGGPDFLYANVFYPNAKNYILMGLEKLGTIPDLKNKSQKEIDILLEHLNQSMQYLNKSGYFVTSHMSKDFSKSMYNGTIHPVLYFAANRGFMVKELQYGYINKTGQFTLPKATDKTYYNGYKLTLVDTVGTERTVYYFSADIADYKIKTFPWFVPFVKSFGKTTCFIKSASYIPAHKNFSIVRNLILDNSVKIIQDDTGIRYNILSDKTKWDFQFWGTYTSTIKDLEWGFQPDFKDHVKNHANNKKLPFRISYNGNYGEGVLIMAVKK